MNPLWAILVVNVIALFGMPFLTHRYAHKNNLKILKEKWICELRNAITELIEACAKLYHVNATFYSSIIGGNILPDDLLKILQKHRDDAYAHVTSSNAKIQLLFKDGDKSYEELEDSIKNLISSADRPTGEENMQYMDSEKRDSAQREFLVKANRLLHQCWNDITK